MEVQTGQLRRRKRTYRMSKRAQKRLKPFVFMSMIADFHVLAMVFVLITTEKLALNEHPIEHPQSPIRTVLAYALEIVSLLLKAFLFSCSLHVYQLIEWNGTLCAIRIARYRSDSFIFRYFLIVWDTIMCIYSTSFDQSPAIISVALILMLFHLINVCIQAKALPKIFQDLDLFIFCFEVHEKQEMKRKKTEKKKQEKKLAEEPKRTVQEPSIPPPQCTCQLTLDPYPETCGDQCANILIRQVEAI